MAVDHLGHPLHPRLVADRGAGVEKDWPNVVLDQLPCDLPYPTHSILDAARGMTALGHFEPFPPPRLNGRCPLS